MVCLAWHVLRQIMKAPYDEVKLDSRLKAVRQELAMLKSRDVFHHSLRPLERYGLHCSAASQKKALCLFVDCSHLPGH